MLKHFGFFPLLSNEYPAGSIFRTPTRMSTMDDIDDEADEDPYENVPAHVTIPGRKITKEEHRSELQRMQDKLTR